MLGADLAAIAAKAAAGVLGAALDVARHVIDVPAQLAQAAFQHALLASDVKKLESVLDESFVWTHDGGEQVSGRQLLDQLRSGQLKYSVVETSNVTVSIAGDTAIVRGSSQRKRSAIPGATAGDANSFNAFYTLTLVNKGAGWKAVAMHSSRP